MLTSSAAALNLYLNGGHIMKMKYNEPTIEINRFSVAEIITESGVETKEPMNDLASGEDKVNFGDLF